MDKKKEVAGLVSDLFENDKLPDISPDTSKHIASRLITISDPNKAKVKGAILAEISKINNILLESVDFTDSNFWIDQIIDAIKNK